MAKNQQFFTTEQSQNLRLTFSFQCLHTKENVLKIARFLAKKQLLHIVHCLYLTLTSDIIFNCDQISWFFTDSVVLILFSEVFTHNFLFLFFFFCLDLLLNVNKSMKFMLADMHIPIVFIFLKMRKKIVVNQQYSSIMYLPTSCRSNRSGHVYSYKIFQVCLKLMFINFLPHYHTMPHFGFL